MPTESFALAEISPSVTRLVPSERTTGFSSGDSVDRWKDAMALGGWTEAGGSHASVTLRISITSLPVRSPEPPGGDDGKLPGDAVCEGIPVIVVTEPGGEPAQVWSYDPGVYLPPPCPAFPWGTTQGQTYDNWKTALAEALGMGFLETALGGGVMELVFSSPDTGPGANGTKVGGWATGTVWNGGWTMRSGAYRGRHLTVTSSEGLGQPDNWQSWHFRVRLHWHDLDLAGTPSFTFTMGLSQKSSESPPPYSGPAGIVPAEPADFVNAGTNETWYRMCVCPYQFAIWPEGGHDAAPQAGAPARSLFVSMPWVPEDYTGHNAFVFGVNSLIGGFRGTLVWSAFTQFDGGAWSSDNFQRVILPVLRTRIQTVVPEQSPDRLTNTQGALLADNAWVASRREDIASVQYNRIAGKLWNCCIVHDSYSVGTVFAEMQDARWVHVSSEQYHPDYSVLSFNKLAHGAQRCSVWWKVES